MAELAAREERRRTALALLFVALLPLACHLVYFSGDRILYGADAAQLQFPRYKILCDALQEEGRIPLWQHWLYAGSPFHANPEHPTLYPPVLLLASFCTPVWTINLTILAHLSLAAVGMFLLVRRLWLRARPGDDAIATAGGCVGACVFALSYTTRIDHLNLVAYGATHALIPWVLLAADGVLAGRAPRKAAGALGLALGFQVLTGGLYVIPYTAVIVGAWFLFLGVLGGRERARRALGFGALALGCAALIVAGKYLPYREWVGTTNRAAQLEYAEALGTSLGGRDGHFAWAEVGAKVSMYTFFGLTIVLALCALPLWRLAVVRLALALGACFFLVGLGGAVHRFAYEHVPLFDQTRSAVRAWVGVNALIPLLAGLGACGLFARSARLRASPGNAVRAGVLCAALLALPLMHSFRHADDVTHPQRFSTLAARYARWPEAAARCGDQWRAMYADKATPQARNEQFISTLLEVETPAGYLGHVWPRALERHLYDTPEQTLEDRVRFRRRSTLSVKCLVSTSREPGAPLPRRVVPKYVDGNVVVDNPLARARVLEPAVVAGVYGDVESELAYTLLDTGEYPLDNASTVQLARDRELSAAELEAFDALIVCGEPSPQAAAALAAIAAPATPDAGPPKLVLQVALPLSEEDRARVLALEHELALRELERRPPATGALERLRSDATLVRRPAVADGAARGRWVVVSEPWALYGGWSARAESGAGLAIDAADGVSSAVFVPQGEASFRADYAPRAARDGLWLYAAGVLGALILALWPARRAG